MNCKLTVNTCKAISKIDKRIYGSFIEHLGRRFMEEFMSLHIQPQTRMDVVKM